MKSVFILANSADPDEMRHHVAFHPILHCLSKFLFTRMKRINITKEGEGMIHHLLYLRLTTCNNSKRAITYLFICLFCCFTSQVNSYGHGRTVSSPNHTFFLGKLEQAVNQYFVHILSLVTDNNPS